MKKLVIAALGLGLAALMSAGCQKMQTEGSGTEAATNAPAAEQSGGGTMQAQAGTAATIVIDGTSFTVEIAKTDAEKEKGLMGRESLPANAGMWFVFDAPGDYQFYMKDTLIPLDVIFVGPDKKIVYIQKNAVPLSEAAFGPPASTPSQYVLELNGGTADKDGFKVGDAVEDRIGPQ